jgi:HAD superfamily hydrolase (TIGR01509 family)
MQRDTLNKTISLPEAVLLDMDGLLLDTEKVAQRAFFSSCERVDFSCHIDDYAQLTGHGSVLRDKLLANILPKDIDMKAFNHHWWESFHHILSEEVPVKKGAMEFLEYVYSQDIKIVVATSSFTESAEMLLSRAKLRPFIGLIVGGDQVKNAKPAPDIYLKAASSVNVPAQNCMAFEDSDVGTMAAHAAGVPVVQIPDINEPTQECIALGHLIFDSLDSARTEFGWHEDK